MSLEFFEHLGEQAFVKEQIEAAALKRSDTLHNFKLMIAELLEECPMKFPDSTIEVTDQAQFMGLQEQCKR